MKFLNKIFHLEEKGASIKNEIIGGLITFIAMCYILPINDIRTSTDRVSALLNPEENKKIRWDNVSAGLRLFSYGLFKKVVMADTFSKLTAEIIANYGFKVSYSSRV